MTTALLIHLPRSCQAQIAFLDSTTEWSILPLLQFASKHIRLYIAMDNFNTACISIDCGLSICAKTRELIYLPYGWSGVGLMHSQLVQEEKKTKCLTKKVCHDIH